MIPSWSTSKSSEQRVGQKADPFYYGKAQGDYETTEQYHSYTLACHSRVFYSESQCDNRSCHLGDFRVFEPQIGHQAID